jgi:hypothetical protein
MLSIPLTKSIVFFEGVKTAANRDRLRRKILTSSCVDNTKLYEAKRPSETLAFRDVWR